MTSGCAPCFLLIMVLGCQPAARHTLRTCDSAVVGSEDSKSLVSAGSVEALHETGCTQLGYERYLQAADTYSQLVERIPQDADAHYYLGVALSKQHEKAAAAAAFEKALADAPAFVEALWSLALLYNESGDKRATATEMANRAVELAPEQAYCHFVLGFILFSHGQDGESAKSLSTAIRLDGSMVHAHYYLGLLHQRVGDTSAAIKAFEEVIERDPHYAQAYYNLASLYSSTGRTEEGTRMAGLFRKVSASRAKEDQFRVMLDQQDTDGYVHNAGTHYGLGQVYLKRGLLDRARSEFEAALGVDSNHAEAANNLGVVLSQGAEPERAVSLFLMAVRIKPEYGLAWGNLGQSYLALGKYPLAEESYRRAIALHEDSKATKYGLGTALIQQGKVDEGHSFRVSARR